MVAKKRKSKRQTLQQKYKIQKRTKEHHKRLKKGVLVSTGKKKKVDNHIPNAWPYKEDLLKEIQVAKDKMEEVKLRQKEKRSEEMSKRRTENKMAVDHLPEPKSRNTLSAPAQANLQVLEAEDDTGAMDIKGASLGQNSRRAFLRELRKVVDSGDVILHVLDARDPMGTKSSAIEEIVLGNAKKKLVYVLNKADLVPREVLAGWLKYLRKSHPAVPFKCNTQTQKGNLGSVSGKVTKTQETALQTNQAVGAEELIGLLKNYCRSGDVKSIISVGIVGFPNVGKSSLINSLMRSRAVGVSSMPGHTRVHQEVTLDKNIRLIDSPGIVFADGDSAATSLRNCVNVEELEDILTPIQAILERCPPSYLMQLYAIPKFQRTDCVGFLALVARATGKLKKGGIPNTDSAGRSVLHDWNNGRIKYYCLPPVHTGGGGAGEGDSAVLSSFSDGIDLSALEDSDIRVLDKLQSEMEMGARGSFVGVTGVAPLEEQMTADDFHMETEEDAVTERVTKTGKGARSAAAASAAASATAAAVSAMPTVHEPEVVVAKSGRRGASAAASAAAAAAAESNISPVSAAPAGLRSTGVLSRNASNATGGLSGNAILESDVRKGQKKDKKKQLKGQRRDAVAMDEGGAEEGGEYSFATDFHY